MLQTLDMQTTIDWYVEILGFECLEQMENHWCTLKRDGVELMFMHNDQLGPPIATATQYIYVDDVMALWETIKERIIPEWGPEKMPYGMLEFAIKDPNGYLLSFGQLIKDDN